MVKSMNAFYMFDLILESPVEIEILMVDQVVNGCVIADILSRKEGFYIPYSTDGQGITCDKIPRRRLTKLPGPAPQAIAASAAGVTPASTRV